MTRAEREERNRAATMLKVRRLYRRDVVSVTEVYRTKRGNVPVGDATLTCGHVALVNMDRPARWRICWTCHKSGLTVVPTPPAPEEAKP